MLKSLLFSRGFNVDIAADGEIAQRMLSKKVFDLLIVDMSTSSRELYRYVDEEHLDCKIIFVSGDFLDSDMRSFLREVNQPFLPKPFNIDQLIAAAGWRSGG
jgi:DNA-binding response OmpR family regulator